MSSSTVSAFLAEFVDPAMHDQARDAMSALFAQLHLTLARNFFDTYAALAPPPPVVVELVTAPAPAPAPAPVKKKKTEVQALPCSAVTAKGEACPRRCCAEAPDTFCAAHLAQSLKEPKDKKARAEPKPISKKAARAAIEPCSGKTAKGGPCTRKCCAESDAFCTAHLAQSLKPAKVKAKKSKASAAPKKAKASKPVKPVPTHNHALTEEVEANCDLCQSHGNASDPELTDTQFEEISGDLQSRLKSILSNLHEVEEEDEETEEDLALASEEEEETDLTQYEACASDDDEEEEEETDEI